MKTQGEITLAILFAIVLVFFMPVSSFCGISFTPLDPINHGLRFPEDVAISPDGKIYVVDGSQGQVMVYNASGAPESGIRIPKPTSVAVNGFIYVGTNEDLSVKILDASHQITGVLGKGAGEFKFPRNIAIDKTTGNVYVVDQLDHSVKVYTATGAYLRTMNDQPNLPQDVTIMNNEVYVIDYPLITDAWGGKMRGATVRVFDTNGNVIRAFGAYGNQEGQMIRPSGIVSGTDGTLYVSDAFHGAVLCFDGYGTYRGAVHNPSRPMLTPAGIAVTREGKMYVASINTASVYIFGLEGESAGVLEVLPGAFTFSAEEGQQTPPAQNLTLKNTGTATITYNAQKSADWILLSGQSGPLAPGATGVIQVMVNITGLSAVIHTGRILITDSTGDTKTVSVTLTIKSAPLPSPLLNVVPSSFNFTYTTGETDPPSQTLTIGISNGAIAWNATADSQWIEISPLSGNGDVATIAHVYVKPSGLQPGEHTGNITVDATGAGGSPAVIQVALTINNGGSIHVSCTIDEASFMIKGPVDEYAGSGKEWTKTGVPDGTYTITFDNVRGYKPPRSASETITNGCAINFKGEYVNLAKREDIIVSRWFDHRNSQAIGIFTPYGEKLFSFVPQLPLKYKTVSGVRTAAADIDGDGNEDIVAAFGEGVNSPAEIAVYRADGVSILGNNLILSTSYGASVAAADFDGDGMAEVVTGAGAHEKNPAQVRVFKYVPGMLRDTGINLKAFETNGGVNVATGDTDGDGVPEIIAAAGASSFAGPMVHVWKVNAKGTLWSAVDTGIHFIAFDGKYGANVTTGDLDADGTDEIVAASGPDPYGGPNIVKAFNGDGTEFGLIIHDGSAGYGLSVASADLDNDGAAEIITGPGPARKTLSTIKVYKADGTILHTFDAFSGSQFGAYVSAGDLCY